MKKYDLFTIIKPNLDNDEADKVVSRVEEIVKTLGGSVSDCDKMGRKKLAYDIKDFRDGYFTVHKYDMEPAQAAKFIRQLRLNENILRTMLLETSEVKA